MFTAALLPSFASRKSHSAVWFLALCIGGLTACQVPHPTNFVLGPDYQVGNAYQQDPVLPSDLRRVALLPLIGDENQLDIVAGCQSLEPVLRTELLKTRKFEIVSISPDDLRQWTGRKSWSAEDKLPPNFFNKLHEQTGADGVLFARVTRFHAYPPMVIGWSLKLFRNNQAQSLWAIDEIFDAGDPPVSNSARRYEQQHQKGGPVTDSPMILASPDRFGHYTAWAALGTLPQR